MGSTGSIGENTLSLISHANDEALNIVCLTANTNAQKLADQALKYRPEYVVLADEANKNILRDRLSGTGIKIGIGRDALIEAGGWPADFIMAAIIGAAGLEPTLEAVRQGRHLGLANKECLVCAGSLFMQEVKRSKTTLLPVDSEHNAIFQVLNQKCRSDVRKLILTASGGPFRTLSRAELENVTRAEALSHPVWKMGAKITIDSASLMNKGLELIEASYLFDRPEHEIDIIVHPQSIVHSMVEYVDGSVLAQMGSPDMRTPIAYALAWPRRMDTPVKPLNLMEIGRLDFETPDPVRFPALRLAREALKHGGAAPTVLNAANEVAVAEFLEGKISFLAITKCIENALTRFQSEQSFAKDPSSIEDVLEYDERARVFVHDMIAGID